MPWDQALPAGLRVALVHDWLTGMRGGEKVLAALAELFPQAPIFTLIHAPGSVSSQLESHPIHTSFLQRYPGVVQHYRRYLPLFPSAIEDFDLRAFDLILSTSHCVAKGAIPRPGALHLCYCHTPMRYAWDLEHTYFPQRRGLIARWRNLALTGLRAWDVATVPRVDQFVANSRFVAQRIERYYGRRAIIIPPPVDVEFFAPAESTPAGNGEQTPPAFALVVSALAPYKRIDLAITACQELGLPLRVVGTGPLQPQLEKQATAGRATAGRATAGGGAVEFLGQVSAAALRDLYRQARVFVQPGIEDFGIATVEALAAGTPVVALGQGGVCDIVEDGVHGVLYSPADEITSLRLAIDKSLQIRFNKLELTERARSFSVNRFKERFWMFVARKIEELEIR